MFRTIPLSIIGSFALYTQQWLMSYRFADSLRAGSIPSWSCSQAVSKPVWHIPLLCVQWKTPDDGQRNCPKHVEFYSKNNFKKSVHRLGFVIRIYHDARSPESQNNKFDLLWDPWNNVSFCSRMILVRPVLLTWQQINCALISLEHLAILWYHIKNYVCYSNRQNSFIFLQFPSRRSLFHTKIFYELIQYLSSILPGEYHHSVCF